MSRRLFIFEEPSYFTFDFKLATPDLKLQLSILEFLTMILLIASFLKSAQVNKSVCSMIASFKLFLRLKFNLNSIKSPVLFLLILQSYNKPSLSMSLDDSIFS